jgi:hypothetical protein
MFWSRVQRGNEASNRAISDMTGVERSVVSRIVHRRLWAHVQ